MEKIKYTRERERLMMEKVRRNSRYVKFLYTIQYANQVFCLFLIIFLQNTDVSYRGALSFQPGPTPPRQQAGKTKRTHTNRLGWLTTRRTPARASASVRNKRYALSLPRWCVPHAKVDKNSWHLRSEGHASTANFHAARRSAASRRASRSVSMGTAPVTIPSRLHELSRGLPVLIVLQ